MKQLNIWKTSFYTMLAIAAGAFTACVDDDVDKQAPTLELSEEAVAFTGTATEDATVTVRSNRQWTVAYEDEETQKEWMYFKVSGNEVSEGCYIGDGTGKITVGECKEIEKAAGNVAPAFYAAAKAPRLQDSISETMDKAKKDGKELGSKLEDTLNNQLPQLFDDAMILFREQMRQYNKEKPEAPTNL